MLVCRTKELSSMVIIFLLVVIVVWVVRFSGGVRGVIRDFSF